MVEWDGGDYSPEPDVSDLDELGFPGRLRCVRRGRQLDGHDAVDGLHKFTAQMTGGERRLEQQEMCRAVA
jgi:hypothetical protein